jgi:ferrochelatase
MSGVMDEPAYDAVLLVSFGGPEGPDDVRPFLANVTRGRDVPVERLEVVARRYDTRGGVSPINAANRALRAAIESALNGAGTPLPVFWGNRNWDPLLADTVTEMREAGVRRALAYMTSPYASASSCRQYLDDIAAAREAAGPDAPVIDRLRHGFDHPGFIAAFVRSTVAAVSSLDAGLRDAAAIVFTAHSIPVTMADASGPNGGLYTAQLDAVARLVADGVATETGVRREWLMAYQSRSGAPTTSWLEPDVGDVIDGLATPAVVVVPIGFTADHMEVVHDLDTEAALRAAAKGIAFARAATPGTDPDYVAMIVDLVRERLDPSTPRLALGALGPSYDVCPPHCCIRAE